MKKLIYLLLFIFPIVAFGQVSIHMQQPPPNQLGFEDLWKATIINNSNTTYRVYLTGKVTSSKDGKIVDGSTAVFDLPKGIKAVNAGEIGPVTINKSNKKYSDIAKRLGGVPSGDYEICIAVIDASNGQELAIDCIMQTVLNLTQMELVSPSDKSVFSTVLLDKDFTQNNPVKSKNDSLVQKKNKDYYQGFFDKRVAKKIKDAEEVIITGSSQMLFTWMPPSPIPPGKSIQYKINITEIFGRQTAYDALQSNPFYFSTSTNFTSLQYPLSARSFNSGSSYAWQVQAFLNGNLITQSEIREFTYFNPQDRNSVSDAYQSLNLGSISPENTSLTLKNILKETRDSRLESASLIGNSEPKKSFIGFTGTAKLLGESSGRDIPGSDMPLSFANTEISSTLAIYNFPLTASILLSTIGGKQNINTFSVYYDKEYLSKLLESKISEAKQKIEQKIQEERTKLEQKLLEQKAKLEKKAYDQLEKLELSKLEDKANQLKSDVEEGKGLLSGPMKFMSYFKTLGIGTNYPDYSKYSVNGVSVTGLDVEFNPGIFYLAFTGLRNQKEIQNEAFKRNLLAGRIGIGKIDKSHFILTGMYAKDDEYSMSIDTAVNKLLKPQANYLVGSNVKLSFMDSKLTLEAEGNVSVLTRDVTAPDIVSSEIPEIVTNLISPKISTSFDYMYAVKTSLDIDKTGTKLSGGISMIGPGYVSLGAPTLRNDKFGFEAKLEQKFLERKISFSAGIKSSRDNLIDSKSSTTSLTNLSFSLGLNFKNYPFLKLMYNPFFQSNDKEITTTDSSKIDNKTHFFTAMAGYNKKLGTITSQTSVSYTLQSSKTLFGLYDVSLWSAILNQSFTFKDPLTLAGSFGYTSAEYTGVGFSSVFSSDLNLNYSFEENIQGSAGLNVSAESTDLGKNSKFSFYGGTNFTLWKYLKFEARAEQIVYRQKSNSKGDYDDFLLRLTMNTTW